MIIMYLDLLVLEEAILTPLKNCCAIHMDKLCIYIHIQSNRIIYK